MIIFIRKILAYCRRKLEVLPFIHHQPPIFLPFRSAVLLAMKRPVDLEKIEEKILTYSSEDLYESIKKLEKSIFYLRKKRSLRKDASNFTVASIRAVCKINPEVGIKFGYRILENQPDERGYRTLVSHLWRLHKAEEAIDLLKTLSSSDWKREQMEKILTWMSRKGRFPGGEVLDAANSSSIKKDRKKKIKSQLDKKINTKSDLEELVVACILDEFSYNSFKHESNFINLSVDQYLSELKYAKPDLVFIESAWRGKNNAWGSKVGHASTELLDIMQWCESNGTPTIFWNKEDPVHFNSFLNVAKLFDYVFTTDIDCIHRYKRALNHNQVYLLPFAFQPKITSPIEKYDRNNGACFAGAYYRKYPERTKDLNNLIDAIKNTTSLEIYDRNYESEDENYAFPKEYSKYIIGSLPFEKIDLAYKGYEFGLNLNTIKQSQTMFARRVFELLASNTLVISNFSRGVKNFFGDLIITSDDTTQVESRIQLLQNDKPRAEKIKLISLRKVLQEHTYKDRFSYVISKICKKYNVELLPHVFVFSEVKSQDELDHTIKMYKSQSYENKSLTILINFIPKNALDSLPNGIKIIRDGKLKENLETIKRQAYYSIFHSSDYYGNNYLTDLVLATRYCESQVITKNKFYERNEKTMTLQNENELEYTFCDEWELRRSIVSGEIINQIGLENIFKFEQDVGTQIQAMSIDKYNYCKNGKDIRKNDLRKILDLEDIYQGVPFEELISISEKITSDETSHDGDFISAIHAYQELSPIAPKDIELEYSEGFFNIKSNLENEKHTYLYWPKLFTPEELGFVGNIGHFT